MNQIALIEPPENHKPICLDAMKTAERELASFLTAVKELFGAEQAEIAANEWLQELEALRDLPISTLDFRQLSINAASRLALRVKGSN